MPKASQEACERSTREEWQGNPEPSTAENSNQGPSTSTTPEFTFTYNCTNGNGAVSYGRDIDKWRRWLLLTTAMFFTWPHHDASGLCTWMLLTCGLKIWCYIVPKDLADNPTEASKAYIELIRASNHIALPTEELLPGIAEVYIVFLEPDVLLIQPPGIMHAVLTPTETISFGGHFLMHDTLHLMEWTRALSHHCDRVGTNDLHPEIQRAISRMMIALSTRPGQKENNFSPWLAKFCTKQIIGVARTIRKINKSFPLI
ncbi:hypothetical protein BC629DRAFT_920579 [Irpex lacteus]|nr:hypothetical protein BC629DRAFT_172423 [Irpex lacteus]KAI0764497.1 hypothetical protein BC629DRAFT_920579 [Irpex lacteus]